MQNVFWLREGVIAGRTGPDRDPWHPVELAASGIGAVLSVNGAVQVHAGDLAGAGIVHQCVPLSDAIPPRAGDFEICLEALPRAMEFAQGIIKTGRSVLVHCTSGKDRTGMFLSYYLCITEHLSVPGAISEVRRVRPIALSAEGWEEFTGRVLQTLLA